MKLIRSCRERGWYRVDPVGRKAQPGPKLGPALPFHSGCWFRRLHCSPGKPLSTISLVPCLWLELEAPRSFAAPVFGHCHPLWDEGAAQQLRAGSLAALEARSLFLCSSLNPWPWAVPGARQPLLCVTRLDKGQVPPARHGRSTAPYGHNGAALQSVGPFSFTSSDIE